MIRVGLVMQMDGSMFVANIIFEFQEFAVFKI